MSLVPWNQFRDNFDRDIDLFGSLPFGRGSSPKIDIYQTEKDVVLKAEIPGVQKEDLNVYVDENSVRLTGQVKKSDGYQENSVYRAERYYGTFSRTVNLPSDVRSDKATAEYKDGILTITAPKTEPSKTGSRKISVQ